MQKRSVDGNGGRRHPLITSRFRDQADEWRVLVVHEFTELIHEFGVDILTSDTCTCGGLAETKAIANRTEEQHIPISPHDVWSPTGTIANVHLGVAVPNLGVLAYHALEVEWWDDLLARSDPLIQDDYIDVPETPGPGVDAGIERARASTQPAKGRCSWQTADQSGRRSGFDRSVASTPRGP